MYHSYDPGTWCPVSCQSSSVTTPSWLHVPGFGDHEGFAGMACTTSHKLFRAPELLKQFEYTRSIQLSIIPHIASSWRITSCGGAREYDMHSKRAPKEPQRAPQLSLMVYSLI